MGFKSAGPSAPFNRVQSAGLGCEWLAAEIANGHVFRRIFTQVNDLAHSGGPNAAVLQGCRIILITGTDYAAMARGFGGHGERVL